jgi:hypothetical protein
MKHLQHTYETSETLKHMLATCVFHTSSSGRCRADWETTGSGQQTPEDGGERRAMPAPGIGPTNDAPLSPAQQSVSTVNREEGGRRRSDVVEMEEGMGRRRVRCQGAGTGRKGRPPGAPTRRLV